MTTLTLPLRNQRTIATAVRLAGFGYWSGQDVSVEFRPALPNTGVVFVRSDFERPRRIAAHVANRIEAPRRTSLQADGATVEMVEHLMAALYGLRIDNCEVWVDRPELPGCDGSSARFVEALREAGAVEQPFQRTRLVITEPLRVGDGEAWVEANPGHDSEFRVRYRLDYGVGSPIGRQTVELGIDPASFERDLAPARTFILQEEADWLRARGLGLRVTTQDLLVFDSDGLRDNVLRYPDECVRHKMLDLVGDLALCGCDIAGRISAFRSGHRLNAELVKAILKEARPQVASRRTA